jgi:hypothetical protein
MKRLMPIVSLLVGCASQRLPSNHTAYEQYSALGYHDKAVAGNFYGLGKADEVKSLYWSQRAAQERPSEPVVSGPVLQRRYVNIPVPQNVQPDGTIQEAHTTAVEIVQFLQAVPRK